LPNAKTIRAMKAARRGELVEAGSPDKLLASPRENDHARKRHDRRVVRLEDFTEEEMALIAKGDVEDGTTSQK
jgi:hypothetical protein